MTKPSCMSKKTNRETIEVHILDNPGCNPKQIGDSLSLSRSTVDHHLNRMIKEERVRKVKCGRYCKVYLNERHERRIEILSYDQESVMDILRIEDSLTQNDILRRTNISQPTLSRCLKALEEKNVIIPILDKRRIRYIMNKELVQPQ